MEIKKIQKIASALDVFFKIAYYLSIAASIIGVIIFFFLWVLYLSDPDILEFFHPNLSFGGIQFSIAKNVTPARDYGFLLLLSGSIMIVIGLPLLCLIFHAIRGMLAPMKKGDPFHQNVSYYLGKLAWLTAANGIYMQAAQWFLSGNLLAGYDLNDLFLSEKITGVSAGHSFNFGFIIYVVILFLLARVFEYGEKLQAKAGSAEMVEEEEK